MPSLESETEWKSGESERLDKKEQKAAERLRKMEAAKTKKNQKTEVQLYNDKNERNRVEAFEAYNKREKKNDLSERIEKIKKIKEQTPEMTYQQINDDLKNKLIKWYKDNRSDDDAKDVTIDEGKIQYKIYDNSYDDDGEYVGWTYQDVDKDEAMKETGLVWPLTESELKSIDSIEEVDPFLWPQTMGGRTKRKTKRSKSKRSKSKRSKTKHSKIKRSKTKHNKMVRRRTLKGRRRH
jgi:hypothetical protein